MTELSYILGWTQREIPLKIVCLNSFSDGFYVIMKDDWGTHWYFIHFFCMVSTEDTILIFSGNQQAIWDVYVLSALLMGFVLKGDFKELVSISDSCHEWSVMTWCISPVKRLLSSAVVNKFNESWCASPLPRCHWLASAGCSEFWRVTYSQNSCSNCFWSLLFIIEWLISLCLTLPKCYNLMLISTVQYTQYHWIRSLVIASVRCFCGVNS